MDLLWSASGKLRQGFSSFRGLVVSGWAVGSCAPRTAGGV